MDALRCPPGDQDVTTLSGGERRRVALCRLLLAAARPAAARRADQPSGRRIGRLARALPAGLPGHRGRDHPRPLLPRQRRRLDPRARPRPRHPLAGQLLVLARAEAEAPRPGGEAGAGAPADARPRARVDPAEPARPPGQEQGPHHRLRGPAEPGRGARPGPGADHDPGRPAARRRGDRGRAPEARATAIAC